MLLQRYVANQHCKRTDNDMATFIAIMQGLCIAFLSVVLVGLYAVYRVLDTDGEDD